MKTRRYIHTLIVVLTMSVLVAVQRPGVARACAGDCSGDHAVTISELVMLVGIALGSSDVSQCGAGDLDGDGIVQVNELIAAVAAALRGCSGDPVAAALAVVRGLSQLENLSDGLAVALDAVGGPEICELGGGLSSTCTDTGGGSIFNPTTADHCRVVTDEGPIEYHGNVEIRGGGQCPDVLDPFDIRFALAWDATTLGPAGERLITAHHDTDVVLETFLFGNAPCIIKGGSVTANGPIVYRGAGDHEVTLTLQDTHATAHFIDLHGNCDPMSVVTEIEGPVRIDDTYGDGPFGLDATLHGVTVTVHRVEHTLEFAGEVDAACFGGPVHIETLSPLAFPLDQPCFTGGTLAIGLPTGTVQLTLGDGGTVHVDRDGDSTAGVDYASCLDLPRDTCE